MDLEHRVEVAVMLHFSGTGSSAQVALSKALAAANRVVEGAYDLRKPPRIVHHSYRPVVVESEAGRE